MKSVEKKLRKNLVIISCFMIFIHSIIFIYMVFKETSFTSLVARLLYIFLFIFYLIFLKKKESKSHIMAFITSAFITIHAGFNYDFLDVTIAIIFALYAYNYKNSIDLKNNNKLY